MRDLQIPGLTPANLAQEVLHLEGKPYSLANYPMFVDIFNTGYSHRLMRSGRQVSKTITMGANMLTDCVANPFNSVLYINSSQAQTSSFSVSKLDPFLVHSPVLYNSLMATPHLIDNVYHKRFKNSSEIQLSYFSESADRVRGKSAHTFYGDEVQDILYDAMIDAEECLSAADNPKFIYAGTSKTVISCLEYLWSISTKKNWIIKCEGCGSWNRPGLKNIGLHGLVCKKCDKPLNTFLGQWYSFAQKESNPNIDGFHIPQIILPMHCQNEEKWAALLKKRENYPDYKFLNEVMGLPIGEGESLITKELLRQMCVPTIPMLDRPGPQNVSGIANFVAGIDWGGGGAAGTSRTTLSIYSVYPDTHKIVKLFCKVYSAGEPSKHVEDIAKYCGLWGCALVFGDHGGGNFAMSQLASLLPGIRVVPVMYSDASAPYKWDHSSNRYIVNRTAMIDSLLLDIQSGKVRCFRWEEFEQFSQDLLAVKEEIVGESSGKARRVWRRYPTKPDDVLHSMVFGWFAARVILGELDFTTTCSR